MRLVSVAAALVIALGVVSCASHRIAKQYAAFFNAAHGKDYAQTTWPSLRADSSNSDFVPMATVADVGVAWQGLPGAAVWSAPTVSSEGNVYVTTGQGAGTSHLHAFDARGQLLWESAPETSFADLDAAAVFSAPTIDASGDLYLSDRNQLWAFHNNGVVKWVAHLDELGIQEPLLSVVLMHGYVGGVSADGKVAFFERRNGKLAVPVLDLPGGKNALGPPLPEALWQGGLIDPDLRVMAWNLAHGYHYEVANPPALHPETGRLFVVGAGKLSGVGAFYGIDLVHQKLEISFQSPVPMGAGPSPVLSPDGSRVYVVGGTAELLAFDALSGGLLWHTRIDGIGASPSVGPDEAVYVLAGPTLVALDGEHGTVRWTKRYDELAEKNLPTLAPTPGLLMTGVPVAYLDSAVTVTANQLWTSLMLGYELRSFDRTILYPSKTVLVALQPEDGSFLRGYELPNTSESGISVGRDGQLYVGLLSAETSMAFYSGYDLLLPQEVRVSQPEQGLVAFVPLSYRDLCAEGVDEVGHLLSDAQSDLVREKFPSARRLVERALSQLHTSRQTVWRATEAGELTKPQAKSAVDALEEVENASLSCLKGLGRKSKRSQISLCDGLALQEAALARAKVTLFENE